MNLMIVPLCPLNVVIAELSLDDISVPCTNIDFIYRLWYVDSQTETRTIVNLMMHIEIMRFFFIKIISHDWNLKTEEASLDNV